MICPIHFRTLIKFLLYLAVSSGRNADLSEEMDVRVISITGKELPVSLNGLSLMNRWPDVNYV